VQAAVKKILQELRDGFCTCRIGDFTRLRYRLALVHNTDDWFGSEYPT